MSIRTKTTLFVVITLGVLVALMVSIQFRSSLTRVEEIEEEQAIAQAERVVGQLDHTVDNVGGTNSDWGWWDATFEFAQDGNQEFIDDNVYADAFTPIGIDLLAVVDVDGNIVHQVWFTEDGEQSVPDGLLSLARPGAAFADFTTSPKATPGGLAEADGRVFVVTSRAILPSNEQGEHAGVLMMATEIDDGFVDDLAALVNLDVVVTPCSQESCAGLSTRPRISKTAEAITTDTVVEAADGTPVLRAQVAEERSIYQESVSGITRVLMILIAVGIAAVLITVAGIRRLVINPLDRLGSVVGEVGRTSDPSLRAEVDRSDEIGELAGGVNVMLARLQNSQRQLVDAKERIEGASDAKSRFLARVSHELRTPINGVLAYAQLMQLDPLDEATADSVEQIINAARHITALVDEFLDVARIEAGAIPLNLEPVNPAAIASEVIAMTKPLSEAQGTVISLAAPEDALVRADALRLRQAVLNLVSNAIKYGGSGRQVAISVRPSGRRFAIEVADEGPGIPADRLERLFIPFDRLDADDTGKQGSGVGLSVTQQLVELMDGTVEVTSEVGVGTTFTIVLPTPTEVDEAVLPSESEARYDTPVPSAETSP
ncbi:MAG: HAMP domain-containing protein [Microthrixaceae bacterium]|nr:HAMP domain-containing protein [Microthrixaceae bacterium]